MDMRLMSPQEQAAELGVRIRRERLRQNLSQATLGRRAGVGRLTVTRMESGDNTNLTNFLAVLSALRRSGDLEKLIETLFLRPSTNSSPPPSRYASAVADEHYRDCLRR
ncbi:MAG: helix-turn-helix transcriptional regulator [Actinobacteria bacterium]|nr:helix-turn-helix transcriptional regulator [Actinomycetota bacterium]